MDDLLKTLMECGFSPVVIDGEVPPKIMAADPLERAKSRENAGYNRTFALQILAEDRKTWLVEMGMETLYFPDNSFFMRIPAFPEMAEGKAYSKYIHSEWVLGRVLETLGCMPGVAKENPAFRAILVDELFFARSGEPTGLSPDMSKPEGYPCEDVPYLEVYTYTEEEKEKLWGILFPEEEKEDAS